MIMKLKETSIRESNFNIGSTKYTDKNMTPTDILSLAHEYVQLPIGKVVGNKQDTRVNSFIDLQNLTGLKYDYVKKSIIKSSKPALIVHLLKNKLVTKDEYIKLYKDLVDRTKQVGKYVSNSDSANRNTKEDDIASKFARRDMKYDFNESMVGINESGNDPQVIEDLRWIVKNKQNKKVKDPISGKTMRVDLFSASAVIQVYDNINDANKKKYVTASLPKMVSLAFKLLK